VEVLQHLIIVEFQEMLVVAEHVQQDMPVKQMEPALEIFAPVLMTAMLVQLIVVLIMSVSTPQ
jgi:hypothetical protein